MIPHTAFYVNAENSDFSLHVHNRHFTERALSTAPTFLTFIFTSLAIKNKTQSLFFTILKVINIYKTYNNMS